MPLDFRVLKQKLYFDEFVPMEYTDHEKLMSYVKQHSLPLLSRVITYEGKNITYQFFELKQLLWEIQQCIDDTEVSQEVKALANKLKELVSFAEKEKKPIEVLAD